MPVLLSSLAADMIAGRTLSLMEACALSAGARCLLDVGPAAVPCGGRLPVLRAGEHPTPHRDETLAVCCFALSMLSEQERRALFLRLGSEAARTLFIDFKMPERNLEWPGFLLFSPLRRLISRCGESHAGGMEGMLHDARTLFTVVSRHTFCAGALCGILVQNQG